MNGTMILIHGLLRVALQELDRGSVSEAYKNRVQRDIHRAYIATGQEIDRETKTA